MLLLLQTTDDVETLLFFVLQLQVTFSVQFQIIIWFNQLVNVPTSHQQVSRFAAANENVPTSPWSGFTLEVLPWTAVLAWQPSRLAVTPPPFPASPEMKLSSYTCNANVTWQRHYIKDVDMFIWRAWHEKTFNRTVVCSCLKYRHFILASVLLMHTVA